MSILHRIAFYQNRRDEVPNQELAQQLVETQNRLGIHEIAENLWNKDVNVQFDCIKVLYEIGYRAPELIIEYASDFLKLLHSRHKRLVWGGMLALSTIASLAADAIYPQRDEIYKAMERGSVITVDAGVLTLAQLAASTASRCQEIFPYLLKHLQTCRPKDVPQHAEKILVAVDAQHKEAFIHVLEKRMEELAPSQAARVKKVMKQAGKR